MLDFYLIEDKQPQPPYPEQANLKFAGNLDKRVFQNLRKKDIIEKQYKYSEDFRWNSVVVEQKYRKLLNIGIKSDSDLERLFNLLSRAKEMNCGLSAYCD